jgi:glycosyltransferase involved in cell wall biosynthesis
LRVTVTPRVVITGPISPADIADLLTEPDLTLARSISGYRGVPTSELVRALVGMGIEVEVVTCAAEVEDGLELRGPGLRVLVGPRRQRARDLARDLFRHERRAMGALLRQTEGEVVHAMWTYEFAWAALDTGRPVLVTAHDAPLTILRQVRDPYRAMRAAMAYIVRTRIRNLTAVSPYLAQRWRREMLYRRPIAVIPNIAPVLLVESGARFAPNGAALIDVTDAGRRKNVRALVEALAYLRAEGRDLTLNLVGPGLAADDAFARSMRARGLGEGVEFHGTLSRASLAEVMARSTVFVHPSREEACPMSLLEAMNAGLPVVGGIRSGGVPWVLGDAGVLVDIERPADIADAVRGVLDDEHAAMELADRGRKRATDFFGAEVVAKAHLDAYERTRRNGSERSR